MKPISIIVIEDSETSAMLIKSIFEERKNYSVTIVNNGTKALDVIRELRPDIVLLDLMMPDMDGYTILKNIRNDEKVFATPVVIVSAKDKPEDIEFGMKLGATEYVVKPIGINKLFERVETLLQKLFSKKD